MLPHMNGTGTAPDSPQFHTNEKVGTETCGFCGMAIRGASYRVGQQIACAACAPKPRAIADTQSSQGPFARALFFGLVAAIAGLVIYAAFEIMTGWIIGYVALLVGFMVGKAIMFGSGGVGGRRYQVAAALLTYAAVSLAAIPVAISYQSKHAARVAHVQAAPQSTTSDATSSSDSTVPSSPSSQRSSPGVALGTLLMLGLASPFLELAGDPFHGLIGLIILFVGIRIAWRTTQGRAMPAVSARY